MPLLHPVGVTAFGGVICQFYGGPVELRLFGLVDDVVGIGVVELCQHAGGVFCHLHQIEQHSGLGWHPGSSLCRYQRLLYFDLLYKVEVGLLPYPCIDLHKCMGFLVDPDGSGKGKVLLSAGVVFQAVAITPIDIKAVYQVIIVIELPTIGDGRNKLFAHDVKPVLVKVVFLKGGANELGYEGSVFYAYAFDPGLFDHLFALCRITPKVVAGDGF